LERSGRDSTLLGRRAELRAMAGKAALVEQIKSIQRSDPEAKQSWWDYCDTNLGGVKDPNRHDASVLEEFFSMYNSGSLPAAGAKPAPRRSPPARAANAGSAAGYGQSYGYQPSPAGWGYAQSAMAPTWGAPAAATWGAPQAAGYGAGAGSGSNLAEMIKTGQRQSESWKTAWKNYCAIYGTGKFDPTKYEDDFIVGFVNYVGDLACGDLGGQADERGFADGGSGMKRPMHSAGMGQQPPAKRQAIGGMETANIWGNAGATDSSKVDLVNKIKALQRSDPEAKNNWWQFCDENLGGVKDPNRHDADTLAQFLETYG